ncbi:hypothetical protein NIES4106_62430 (plasmid) [Fischerella sp. NIES-4106]|nr:hypothetical protein NIES4106_62430 [Fischerella sp. NIES-4106]
MTTSNTNTTSRKYAEVLESASKLSRDERETLILTLLKKVLREQR